MPSFYKRARTMLGAEENPHLGPADRMLKESVEAENSGILSKKPQSECILEIPVKLFLILILADKARTAPVANSVAVAWWAVVMGQKILSISITFISLKNREPGYFRTRKFWTFNLFKRIRKAKRVTKFSAGRILLMEPQLRGYSKPGGLYFLQVFWAHCLCC